MDYSKFREIEITDKKLDFWIEKSKNVMLFGKHGVGKSTIIMSAFDRNGLSLNKSYKMFSGGTLDPWVDFIGIPKKVKSANNGEDVIGYVRPEYMDESIEAIFMDEYNRTSKAVRNALMELIQFKSINGKSFPNLRMVWAACNPDGNDAYDVEEVDPAQGDRFQIIVNMPYSPSYWFFHSKYGENIAKQAINWWKAIPDDAKDLVSPRRLDYAVEYLLDGGDAAEILPINSDVVSFKKLILLDPAISSLDEAIKSNDGDKIKSILNDAENLELFKDKIFPNKSYFNILGQFLSEEQLSILINKNDKFFNWGVELKSIPRLRLVFKSIYESIEDESKYNAEKLKRLKSSFLNPSNMPDSKLFISPSAVGYAADKSTARGWTLTELENELRAFIARFDIHQTKNISPKFHWNRVKENTFGKAMISAVNDKESVSLILSYANILAKSIGSFEKISIEYPSLIELVNTVIINASNAGTFREYMYYSILNDFRFKVDSTEGFVIREIVSAWRLRIPTDVELNTSSLPADPQYILP